MSLGNPNFEIWNVGGACCGISITGEETHEPSKPTFFKSAISIQAWLGLTSFIFSLTFEWKMMSLNFSVGWGVMLLLDHNKLLTASTSCNTRKIFPPASLSKSSSLHRPVSIKAANKFGNLETSSSPSVTLKLKQRHHSFYSINSSFYI